MPTPIVSVRSRFAALVRIDFTSGCHFWRGTKDREGYGIFGVTGLTSTESHRAHRVAWMLENGPIPKGAIIIHACDTPSCVNAEHLRIGTKYDNSRDRVEKGRMGRLGPKGVDHEAVYLMTTERSQSVTARHFGISVCMVKRIVRKRRTQSKAPATVTAAPA